MGDGGEGHVQEACANAVNCVQALRIGLRRAAFVLGQPDIPITEPILQRQLGKTQKVLLWLLQSPHYPESRIHINI